MSLADTKWGRRCANSPTPWITEKGYFPMINMHGKRKSPPKATQEQYDEITNELIAATSRSQPRRFNAYDHDSHGSAVELAKRLAAVINTAPFSMWSAEEGGDLGEEFYMVAADMARSPRANRLAIAFGQAAAAGMPESTLMLVLVDWCGVTLPVLAQDGAAILRETIALAHALAVSPDPQAYPDVRETLERLDYSEGKTGSAHAVNDTARNAVERFVNPMDFSAGSAGYGAWFRSVDVLGAIESVFGGNAEPAFEECERILGSYIYAWRPEGTSANLPTCRTPALCLLPPGHESTGGKLTVEERAEAYPEHAALKGYLCGALAEAGGSESGERRVLLTAAEALLEEQLADITASFARKRALLREARLDGRELPAVVASYQRALLDRDAPCTGEAGCTHCSAESAYSARFAGSYEAEDVIAHAFDTRSGVDRLLDILDAIDAMTPFAETSERVFAAALKRLQGERR